MTTSRIFKIVDLFAGPGGLAEGFSSLKEGGRAVFDIALSVEKEPSAFRTLRLRAFTRQFHRIPDAYYSFIAGDMSREELIVSHPAEWKAAVDETAMLELGTDEAREEIDQRLKSIRGEAGDDTVLIGGPPCQAYSLVGRAQKSWKSCIRSRGRSPALPLSGIYQNSRPAPTRCLRHGERQRHPFVESCGRGHL